ncbi:glycosyl hydrolase family 61-domain-containing protein [Aspergillus aurantiobrunneus]
MTFIQLATILGAASTAAAHGFVSSINVGGQEYPGYDPSNGQSSDSQDLIAWSTTATDQGYVEDVHSPDIICHEGAEPGAISAEVPAGGTVTVTWSQWLSDHKGPVIDYLANCNGECSNVDKTTLSFFKVDEAGLKDGTWGSDKLIDQGSSWDITIPSDLQAGNYVLRHEIIALHSSGNPQPYPQCVNIKVTGSGSSAPAGVPGMQLYSPDEPGLKANIWNNPSGTYDIPGPQLYAAGDSSAKAATGSTSDTSAGSSSTVQKETSTSTTACSNTNTGAGSSSASKSYTPDTDRAEYLVRRDDEEMAAEDVKRSFLEGAIVLQLGGVDWNCTRL